jgi:trk system potassium uptake protein TrkA
MKYIIIGLGNFGGSIAQKLTLMGHEVIGVDNDMNKVDALRESITHVISLNSTDQHAVKNLPLSDTDVVMVCIGEDEGANIMATAIMKKMNVKRLISRAVNDIHQTVLEAMGVDEIIHPEEETADRWAKKLNMTGIIDSFEITGEYSIIEAKVPKRYVGQTILDSGIRKKYKVLILTTIKLIDGKNDLGSDKKKRQIQGVASYNTVLEANDIMVLFGKLTDIERLLEE